MSNESKALLAQLQSRAAFLRASGGVKTPKLLDAAAAAIAEGAQSDADFFKELIRRARYADRGYFEYRHLVAVLLPKDLREQLKQLHETGPVWDGDIVSKSRRDTLLALKLAVRCCVKGEDGFTSTTPFGGDVAREVDRIRKGETAA
jgi:hypothetical protein